jgi:phage baseplate assembly protein gpV
MLRIAYGVVKAVNKTLGTCDIEMKTGFLVKNIQLMSVVPPGKDPISGGVKYPRLETEVKLIYPENDMKNGFILPGTLDFRDADVVSDILGGADTEVLPEGWRTEYDPETGNYTLTDVDTDFSLVVDKENETVEFTDWNGNTFSLSSTGISIEDANGNTVSMESGKVVINSNVEILQ